MSPLRKAADALKRDFKAGSRAAITNTGGTITGGTSAPSGGGDAPSAPPAWAKAIKDRQTVAHGATIAAHTLRSGDGGGSGASIDTSEKD